jgi:hypothetical protein
VKKLDFRYLIVEVPLLDLASGRLISLFMKDRTANLSGHVQFLTGRSLRRLLMACGFSIVNARRYVPVLGMDTLRFLRSRHNYSFPVYARMVLGDWLRRLTRPVWSYLMYAHYAVLCKKTT